MCRNPSRLPKDVKNFKNAIIKSVANQYVAKVKKLWQSFPTLLFHSDMLLYFSQLKSLVFSSTIALYFLPVFCFPPPPPQVQKKNIYGGRLTVPWFWRPIPTVYLIEKSASRRFPLIENIAKKCCLKIPKEQLWNSEASILWHQEHCKKSGTKNSALKCPMSLQNWLTYKLFSLICRQSRTYAFRFLRNWLLISNGYLQKNFYFLAIFRNFFWLRSRFWLYLFLRVRKFQMTSSPQWKMMYEALQTFSVKRPLSHAKNALFPKES